MTQEALKLALEELADRFSEGWHEGIKIDASDIMLLNEAAQALAQPEQEPVAWEQLHEHIAGPFYTHPPQRTWVDLTDEDISKISQRLGIDHDDSWTDLKQAIEAKLKQKNGFAEEKNS